MIIISITIGFLIRPCICSVSFVAVTVMMIQSIYHITRDAGAIDIEALMVLCLTLSRGREGQTNSISISDPLSLTRRRVAGGWPGSAAGVFPSFRPCQDCSLGLSATLKLQSSAVHHQVNHPTSQPPLSPLHPASTPCPVRCGTMEAFLMRNLSPPTCCDLAAWTTSDSLTGLAAACGRSNQTPAYLFTTD